MTETAKAAFNKKTLSTNICDLNLRKKLVRCYIWNIVLYGTETRKFQKDQKYPNISEIWSWRKMQEIMWTDHVRNEKVLQRIK